MWKLTLYIPDHAKFRHIFEHQRFSTNSRLKALLMLLFRLPHNYGGLPAIKYEFEELEQ